MHNLLTNTANYQTSDVVRLLAMFSFAVLKQQNVTTKLKLSGLILTGLALIIVKDNIQWLIPGSNHKPLIAREQSMSNLIAIVSNTSIIYASHSFLKELTSTMMLLNTNL